MAPVGPAALVVRRVVVDGTAVLLEAEGAAPAVGCPSCGTVTERRHDHYTRRPLDLPWRGAVVRLVVRVRRFVCPNVACARRTFAEDLGGGVLRGARRTADADAALLAVARALGGRAGARLAATAGLPVGRDALLRLLRRSATGSALTPRVLGVDDLALRRGRVYATLLVDLEARRPVDLLAGRDAATLAAWLARHPGVEVVVRDRAGAYAEGAARGAPTALQVADRFHLVQNASAALTELLKTRKERAVYAATPADPPDDAVTPEPTGILSPTKQRDAARRAAKAARWEEVRARHAGGESLRSVARAMGLARQTVRRLAGSPVPPKYQRTTPPRPPPLASPTLAPHVEYLRDRWQEGCTNGAQLCREIVARGYTGTYSLMQQAIIPWRPPRVPSRDRRAARRQRRRLSVRWLCLRPPTRLDTEEQTALRQLLEADPELARGYRLLQRFRALIADRDTAALITWLTDARGSGLAPFAALANGIDADRAAVDAALTTEWSNGPVEGQVFRVKLLKRQGYGRAKLDLLRTRVLAP
jgi:transposase